MRNTVFVQIIIAILIVPQSKAMKNLVEQAYQQKQQVINQSRESFNAAQEKLEISIETTNALKRDPRIFEAESISEVEKAAAQIIQEKEITDQDIQRLKELNERRLEPEPEITPPKYMRLLKRYNDTQINLLQAKQQVQILQGQLGNVVTEGGNYQQVIDEMKKQSEPMSKWISSLEKYLTGSLITTCIAVLAFCTKLPMMKLDKELKKLDILLKHKELEEG